MQGISPEKHAATVHITRRTLIALWGLIAAPWVLVGALAVHHLRWPATSKAPDNGHGIRAGANCGVVRGQPGPWGELLYTRIVLEPPDEYVDLRETMPTETRWLFKGKSQAEAEQFLRDLGVTATQQTGGSWEQTPLGAVLKPSATLVASLRPEVRARLYGYLAEFEENHPQANPYRFSSDRLEEWLGGAGLRPETLHLVRHYVYRLGTSLAFADGNIVFPQLRDGEERRRLLKALSRRVALRVELRVTPQSDIPALTTYWSVGGRSKDIAPLLDSLARLPGGGSIDIVHLLPRFARIHLNTYPNPIMTPGGPPLNCHWSSLNFFRHTPDDSLATTEGAARTITENYYEIVGAPRLGDVLLFSTSSGAVIHSCVYVADDVVFTKNGISLSTPWVLMRLPDVAAYYTSAGDPKIRIMRPKERVG
ncbi:MAG: hypothetical protein N3B01_07070 [Verrucomicrobiae bacterium]|nr:hypothetical protein [Verrucomicrobiae bacterium]